MLHFFIFENQIKTPPMSPLNIGKFLTPFQVIAAAITIALGGLGIWSQLGLSASETEQLTGKWILTLEPKESSKPEYIGEVYVFEMNVFEENGKLTGRGEQTLYNGKMPASHYPITLDKIDIKNEQLVGICRINGARDYDITLNLSPSADSKSKWTGKYETPMAVTRGSVMLVIQ
jgi:hypothetical protein